MNCFERMLQELEEDEKFGEKLSNLLEKKNIDKELFSHYMCSVFDIFEKEKGIAMRGGILSGVAGDAKTIVPTVEVVISTPIVIHPGQTQDHIFNVPFPPSNEYAMRFMPSQLFGIELNPEFECVMPQEDHMPVNVVIRITSKINIAVTLKSGTVIGKFVGIQKSSVEHIAGTFDMKEG